MRLFLALLSIFFTLNLNANQLQNHSSPYLALHGNDPVNWMEWGKPALEKAKKENKLLFVSIGYFSCHWCHVMQRESFADKDIAKLLNKNYISIKVDRELNPVLDKRLIEFVQVSTGTAGWPLNVFLTPDAYPLVGATYMPPEQFSSVLKNLTKKWKAEQVSLSKQAKEMSNTLVTMLEEQEQPTDLKSIKSLSENYVNTAMQYADTLQGGFGHQQKFPQIPQLWALLKLNKIKKNEEADEFLELTLAQMAQQGLHDELSGGFYRYTTDPDWETPHFEKMLYTNALMPLLYFDAADQYKNMSYRETAMETLDFLKNEMLGKKNAFVASLSAVDDKGEEGGYYLWKQQELKEVLNPQELKLANLYWNLSRSYELSAGNLPRQYSTIEELAEKLKSSPTQITQNVNKLKNKLRIHRNKSRNLPRDTKLLAGMNGLTLAAFSRGLAYDASLEPTGENLAQFLISLWDGKTLRRSSANKNQGDLYDYAAVSWGLMKWGKATNNNNIIKVATDIATTAWARFYENKNWIENPDSLLPQGIKQAHIADSALISAEALLLEASLLSEDPKIALKVNDVLKNITQSLETDIYGHPSILSLVK